MVTAPLTADVEENSGERGGASVFMIMTLGFLLIFAAISFDIGQAFNAKREATNIAATAARSGANAVDPNSLYSEGVAVLDAVAASAAIQSAIPSHAQWISNRYHPGKHEVEVVVEVVHETVLLGMIGIDSIPVRGVATARVQNGAG